MPPVDIVLIRGIDHFLAIRAQCRFEDLKISGCEEFRLSSLRRNAIQVEPTGTLPGKHDAVIGAPKQLALSRNFMKQAAGSLICLPWSLSSTCNRVANPDRPGLSATLPKEIVRSVCGNANECDLFAVGRPVRIRIAIHTGSEPNNELFAEIVNSHASVATAFANECQLRTVRRPSQRVNGPLRRDRSLGLLASI